MNYHKAEKKIFTAIYKCNIKSENIKIIFLILKSLILILIHMIIFVTFNYSQKIFLIIIQKNSNKILFIKKSSIIIFLFN